jgi:hypothetical protein
VRQVLLLGGQGVRVSLGRPGQLSRPVLQSPEFSSRGVQALLSLRDVLLLARILLPGCIQVGRRGPLACHHLGVLLLAQVALPGSPGCRCPISSDMHV